MNNKDAPYDEKAHDALHLPLIVHQNSFPEELDKFIKTLRDNKHKEFQSLLDKFVSKELHRIFMSNSSDFIDNVISAASFEMFIKYTLSLRHERKVERLKSYKKVLAGIIKELNIETE